MKLLFSLSHTLFLYAAKDLDEEIHSNFTKDFTLHKNTCHGAVTLLCSKGVAWLGRNFPNNTNNFQSNAVSLHSQKPSV